MANRDHSRWRDYSGCLFEFLLTAFRKPLHKIAEKAGVTTGAIYTRYKNKDALFASLLQEFFEAMQVLFAPVAEEYEKAKCSAQPEGYPPRHQRRGTSIFFWLLTEHRDDCTLFFLPQ